MRKKQKNKKKNLKNNTHFGGGLENGQEVVPPFFFPKNVFLKMLKSPFFIAFPEKVGGGHFFKKDLGCKEGTFRGAKK